MWTPVTYLYMKHNLALGEAYGERKDLQFLRGKIDRQEHDVLPLSYVRSDGDWTLPELSRPERKLYLLQVRVHRALGGLFMGKVAATYNLMPDGPSIDMEALKAKMPGIVPEGVTILKGEVKPFAFGLNVLEITFLMNDSEGITDRLEEKLRSIEGIQGVESTQVTLV